ncbi:MAG: nucleoside 2-deoxyribosyltransferase [Candidatus Paceibacterota bacterium]
MSKIYVASNNVERAQSVMSLLKQNGHTITFDWTIGIENSREQDKEKAITERDAIRNSDALVYLWEENQESARYEAGMAMGLGKKVIVSGDHKSFFFQLPGVISIESDDKIIENL